MTYTDLEIKAIAAFKVGFNYQTAEDEIADNATALSVQEIADECGISIAQAKGVIGSLTKKGLLTTWDEPDMEFTLHITENGINAHYEVSK